MKAAPQIPEGTPFTPEQRAWINGFFAGAFSHAAAEEGHPHPPAAPEVLHPLVILYGSQTGTAEGLAKKAARAARQRGFAATAIDMAEFEAVRLPSEHNLLVITSTYGNGEPPDNARTLHAALGSAAAPALARLHYSVCSLGDTHYTRFCQCGRDFDARLEQLGAIRIHPRAECDFEHEEPFAAWLDASLSALMGAAESRRLAAAGPAPAADDEEAEPRYSKENPYPARVLTVRVLNAPGSAKEVNHLEFSLEDSGLAYEAGDALGVLPQNCPELVDDVLAALGHDGEEAVAVPGGSRRPLRRALLEHFDLGKPTAELLALCAVPAAHHVIDALLATPVKPAAAALVGALDKLHPRLYSISSSPKTHPGHVHLTVGAVRYEKDGRSRKGACSAFLAERALGVGQVGVFVHANHAFRPPPSGDLPMIMVGPGTGIAPFRGFLADRVAAGAKGRNWLFFGDQRSATDFLYREELLALQAAGILTRLDLAFSRDQPDKVYVQQRMQENAAELFAWLEAGAHFYVCGDASRMARDVDAALHQVIESAGGKSPAEAAAYVQHLQAAKRYCRDVY